jgi:hypothetical protein
VWLRLASGGQRRLKISGGGRQSYFAGLRFCSPGRLCFRHVSGMFQADNTAIYLIVIDQIASPRLNRRIDSESQSNLMGSHALSASRQNRNRSFDSNVAISIKTSFFNP